MQLPGISELGTADFAIIAAALGVLGIYLLLSIIRGTIRFILITASTAAGGISAWFTLHYAPGYGGELLKSAPDWVLPGLTIIAGFLGFIVLKSLLFIIFKPITFSSDDDKKDSGFSVIRSLMALTCGLVMAWGGGVLLRYAGTIAELRLADEQGRNEDTSNSLMWKVADWKQRFELSEIGEWHRGTDPWAEPEAARLAAILLQLQAIENTPSNLQSDAENAAWNLIRTKLRDSDIQSLIEDADYPSLLQSPALQNAELSEEELDLIEKHLSQNE